MKAKRLKQSGAETTWVLVFDRGDEVVKTLTAFAKEHGLSAAHFTAIGAFSEARLGYFQRDKKDYKKIPVNDQVEVLSLIGDIALEKAEPKIHAHAVLGTADGGTRGGHLLEATVWPTLEVVLTESPQHLRKKIDPEVGLALIDLDAA
jgi:predicted DNA-binding protein with PD1-like motif